MGSNKMNPQKIDEIDALILEEKRTIAREHFLNAWDAAIAEGIEPQIIARALVHGALSELASHNGDKEAAKMISDIRAMEASGEFLLDKTLQ